MNAKDFIKRRDESVEKFIRNKCIGYKNLVYLDIKNCQYTKGKNKGQYKSAAIKARRKLFEWSEKILSISEYMLYNTFERTSRVTTEYTKETIKEFIIKMLFDGGVVPYMAYLDALKKFDGEVFMIYDLIIYHFSRTISEMGYEVTDEIIEVITDICAELELYTPPIKGLGTGPGEILTATFVQGVTKADKGDMVINTQEGNFSIEFKSDLARIYSEGWMNSTGFDGINSKMKKEFPSLTHTKIVEKKDKETNEIKFVQVNKDYINDLRDYNSLPLEAKKFVIDKVLSTWDDKKNNISRKVEAEKVYNICASLVMSDPENLIFKDEIHRDYLYMILNLRMYTLEQKFDMMVIQSMPKKKQQALPLSRNTILDVFRIYTIYEEYIEFVGSYGSGGRGRVPQTRVVSIEKGSH